MRNSVAALGVIALGSIAGAAPAAGTTETSPPGALICHLNSTGTYEPFYVSRHGLIHDLNGHAGHAGDIIPFPGFGGNPAGQNMTPENVAILNAGCVGRVVPPAEKPLPVAPAAPGKAPASGARNPGYNVDGALQTTTTLPATSDGARSLWLAGAPALLAAAIAGLAWRVRLRAKKSMD